MKTALILILMSLLAVSCGKNTAKNTKSLAGPPDGEDSRETPPLPPEDGEETETPPVTPVVKNCPEGFVKIVAGNKISKDLCIARYEMKKVAENVRAQAEGVPHVTGREMAQNLCEVSFENGRLPTNQEWTEVAGRIQANALNWTSGVVGDGMLVSGLTKRWGDPVSVEDVTNGYDQTGASSSNQPEQRRTFFLSEEDFIWDFGGNAWEWVSDELQGDSFTPSFADGWAHNPQDVYWFPVESLQLEIFFSGERPIANNHLGYIFGGRGGYVVRGAGTYMYSQEVGVFSADLGSGSSGLKAPLNYGLPSSAQNIGFRCMVDL